MPTNSKEHLRYRYGICLNDNCSKCKSKEVQQIASRKDFVCEECGKPLRECPPPRSFWDKHGKKIIIAACAVIAIALAGLILRNCKTTNEKPPVETHQTGQTGQNGGTTETPEVTEEPDSTTTEQSGTGEEEVTNEEEGKDKDGKDNVNGKSNGENNGGGTATPPMPQPKISVPFGTYSGPADGMNGTITVTRQYTLDLRDAAHSTIELQPGDKITKTQFRNGELVTGYWQRGSASQTFHR